MSTTRKSPDRPAGIIPQGLAPRYLGEDLAGDVAALNERSGDGTRRSLIVAAAIALLAERGYEGIDMRTLASHVGLKAPTLYNYYSSKDELLAAAIEFGMDDFFSYVLDDLPDGTAREQLHEVVRRHCLYKMRYRILARANDRVIDPKFTKYVFPEDVYQKFSMRMRTYRHTVQQMVAAFMNRDYPASPTLVTIAILTQCDSLAYWYTPEGSYTERRIVDHTLSMVRRLCGHLD